MERIEIAKLEELSLYQYNVVSPEVTSLRVFLNNSRRKSCVREFFANMLSEKNTTDKHENCSGISNSLNPLSQRRNKKFEFDFRPRSCFVESMVLKSSGLKIFKWPIFSPEQL
ncbi:hypothetical protein CDAR_425751 [Caerostris darwini]|uniref:Uncharacterized protein n=1 Tax=Caerostris darwini TaxID=1538125 RepID=A0AAV4VXP7_9ARAC|nr:hypothetical protein CDAR_425751 [Caerostris darwini]